MDESNGQKFASQEFLDQGQYSRNGILRYEVIFGRHFVSTGGRETTQEFVERLKLKKGEQVLDVGCGIGGSAFLMAQEYGAHVLGVDLSTNMLNIANERLQEMDDVTVKFQSCDITKKEFPEASFDVIYSRDAIMHIADKQTLFSRFLHWLKPGGRLLTTDYCCSEENYPQEFDEYLQNRNYILVTPKAYEKILEDAGYINVDAQDRTQQFDDVLKRELARIEGMKQKFIETFSVADYDDIVKGWVIKLERAKQGYQRWGLFYAEKSSH